MRLSCFLLICCCTVGSAQSAPPAPSRLFVEPAPPPLTLRLEGDLRALTRDRGTQRKDHTATLRYGADGDTGSIAVKLRTRGIFRLKNCGFPPIRLDLPSHKVNDTPFAGEDRLKLVTHCQNDRLFERNLLRESDTALARRIGAAPVPADNLYDPLMDPSYMTLVAVFQYLIGNSDWSVWKRHNIAIFQLGAEPKPLLAVPYDYDFSGAVNAPYATPPEQLKIQSVRQRVYRGFCQPDSVLTPVLARFRAAKDSMYAAVRAVPDLPERDVRNVLEYFDEFYQVLGNNGSVNRQFVRGCRPMPR